MSNHHEGLFSELKPLVELTERIERLVRTRLWLQILAGMVLGVLTGILLSPSGAALVSESNANIIGGWMALPGQAFLALIQMVVIPLVMASIILGVTSSGDPAYLRLIGLRVGVFFVVTTTIAAALGITLALWVEPGQYLDRELVRSTIGYVEAPRAAAPPQGFPLETLPSRIVALIPADPARAALDRSMLDIVVFAILMGVALLSISQARAKPMLDLIGSLQEISLQVVSWAMLLAPFAVFGLLAQITMKIGLEAILAMSVYVGTVIVGLALLLVVFVVIVWATTGRGPAEFLSAVREVLLLAFSTSSSAAVMPLSIQTVQEKLGVRPSIAEFIVPVGATVNMSGTALYQVVAAVFLTQVFGIDLTLGGLALLAATTVGASIGSPASPGAGIVILATILQGIGVPAGGIALIMGVDRVLDMSRTTVNVAGDLAACVVMDRWIPRDESPRLGSAPPLPTGP